MIETVLALFVLSIVILLFASFINARDINRRVLYRSQAAALVDQEINALRRIGFPNLVDQVNGSFLNTLYNGGTWTISAPGVTGNRLELAGNSAMAGTVSGRLLFPAGAYGAGTLEAAFKAATGSPSGWAFGFFFHATDTRNGYRLRLADSGTDLDLNTAGTQNLYLQKIVAGAETGIFSKSVALITTDSWYTLKIVLDDTNPTMKIYINNNQQDANTITDTTFTSGAAALIGWNGVHLFVDDVQTVNAGTETWNFDSDALLPAAWIRLGLNDLPDNTPNTFDDNGVLTIAPYPNANVQNLKQATVVVRWRTTSGITQYTSTILIGKSEVGL